LPSVSTAWFAAIGLAKQNKPGLRTDSNLDLHRPSLVSTKHSQPGRELEAWKTCEEFEESASSQAGVSFAEIPGYVWSSEDRESTCTGENPGLA
jgi:hypothetical protein